MEKIDKIILGDNQFFGINHMSQDKAQALTEKFQDVKNIISVYDNAFDVGIKAVMLNSNNRAKEITEYFRNNKNRYKDVTWYPSLPYAHKYATLVAEKGIFAAINEVLFSDNSAKGLLNLVAKGGSALIEQDAVKVMQMLVDIEMKMFRDLNFKVIFLQNIMTDLLLGLRLDGFFIEFAEYVRKKYKVLPGFITMNLPLLLDYLKKIGLENVVICSSINKIGYLMSPDSAAYEEALKNYDKEKYQVMAMSFLASGAIKPPEASEYIGALNIDSVVFGASSYKNLKETKTLLDKIFTN